MALNKVKKHNWMWFLFAALVIIGGIIGNTDHNYQIIKCHNLINTNVYNFTAKVEIDANVADTCYFNEHYPFAPYYSVITGMVLAAMISFFAVILPWLFINDEDRGKKKKKRDKQAPDRMKVTIKGKEYRYIKDNEYK